MSQFDHEGEDQSELLNAYIRENRGNSAARSGAELMALYRQQREFKLRRDAYRGPEPKRHLQDEIYRSIAGALSHFQAYALSHALPLAELNGVIWDSLMRPDPLEHAVHSLHAMIFQELDLYLEEQ